RLVDVLDGELGAFREDDLRDELRRLRADDVGAEDLARARVRADLDESLGFADRDGLAVRAERKASDLHVASRLARFGLRETDARDLRLAVDAGGDARRVEGRRILAAEMVDRVKSLERGRVSERGRTDDIADRIDTGDARLQVAVDRDERPSRLHADPLEAEILDVSADARGDEDDVRLDLLRAAFDLVLDRGDLASALDRLDARRCHDVDLPSSESALERCRDLWIARRQRTRS